MFLQLLMFYIFIAPTGTSTVKAQIPKPKVQITSGQTMPHMKIETDDSVKRKREDEDYDVS